MARQQKHEERVAAAGPERRVSPHPGVGGAGNGRSSPGTSLVGGPPRRRLATVESRIPPGRSPWLWAALLTVAAAGLALFYRFEIASPPGRASSSAVRTAKVRQGVVERSIRLTGNTAAANSMVLRAPYLRGRRSSGSSDFGLVLQNLIASGSHVAKGDPVARFDNVYMVNRLDNYRADSLESELRLRTLLADLKVKRAAYQQQVLAAKAQMDKAALDLTTAPVRSAIQVALDRLAFDEARAVHRALLAQAPDVRAGERAEVRVAELNLREQQVEQRRAETNVNRLQVRAPVGGLVVVNEIFRGSEFAQIRAGDQLRPGQLYMQIVDTKSMVVEAKANQIDTERLSVGADALVRFDAYPGLELPARVYSVGPLATGSRSRPGYVAEVAVVLKLKGTDERVIPNLTVSADVVLRREESEGIIPRQAVFGDAETGQPSVLVRTESGWEKRALELGLASNTEVAVRSGLQPGEVVALNTPSG